jgi:hypothetical protein
MTLGIIMLLIILFQPGGLWAIYKWVEDWFGQGARGGEHS